MNRKRTSLFLLLLVLLLAGKEVLWLSSFQLLQGRIADKWCINKYDAELMCGGRCYLFQQLEEWNEADQNPAVFKITRLTSLSLFLTPKWTAFSGDDGTSYEERKDRFMYQALRDRLFNIAPFIPPESSFYFTS